MNQIVPSQTGPCRSLPIQSHSAPSISLKRCAFLGILFIAEVLFLTLRYDAGDFAATEGWSASIMTRSSYLLRGALAVIVATLFFSGPRLWRDYQRLVAQRSPFKVWPAYLAGHLLVFLALSWLTDLIFEDDLPAFGNLTTWVVLWWLLGLATVLLLLAAVVPPALWRSLARRNAGPLLIGVVVGLTACGFGIFSARSWKLLGMLTCKAAAGVLGLFTSEVLFESDKLRVGTQYFGVAIDAHCSGFEGIGLIVVFLTAYLWLFRTQLRFPFALLLLPLGVLLIWTANVLRVVALVGIGSAGWNEVALGGFHSQAGWLAFNGLAIGLVAVTTKVRAFQSDAAAVSPRARATAAYLMPFTTMLAVAMITAAISSDFDWLYPLRVLATAAVLWYFRNAYGRWDWSISWVPLALGAATGVFWLLLMPKDLRYSTALSDGLSKLGHNLSLLWLGFRFAGYIVVVPVAEELAFRGYLTRRLVSSEFEKIPMGQFTWLSFLVSSVAFGLIHGRLWPAGIIAGACFAIALWWRGRLCDAIAAHISANAFIAGYALWTASWGVLT